MRFQFWDLPPVCEQIRGISSDTSQSDGERLFCGTSLALDPEWLELTWSRFSSVNQLISPNGHGEKSLMDTLNEHLAENAALKQQVEDQKNQMDTLNEHLDEITALKQQVEDQKKQMDTLKEHLAAEIHAPKKQGAENVQERDELKKRLDIDEKRKSRILELEAILQKMEEKEVPEETTLDEDSSFEEKSLLEVKRQLGNRPIGRPAVNQLTFATNARKEEEEEEKKKKKEEEEEEEKKKKKEEEEEEEEKEQEGGCQSCRDMRGFERTMEKAGKGAVMQAERDGRRQISGDRTGDRDGHRG
ncbi:unnamed protein product [Pleuronectes platessa]|uniref:Uncharacterized protein n=1 Tax=Pleuronectes platessa TaxID=8262 RepID=A0A9N7TGC8_PLEPL|nr:unnamed protein product [Pleuronectes platessa]